MLTKTRVPAAEFTRKWIRDAVEQYNQGQPEHWERLVAHAHTSVTCVSESGHTRFSYGTYQTGPIPNGCVRSKLDRSAMEIDTLVKGLYGCPLEKLLG